MPRLDPAAAIRMARIADMPEVLPLAYYCTIQVYPRRPMIGDGDDLPHEADPEDQIMTHLLTREDLASLALGRESMAIWVAQRAKSCLGHGAVIQTQTSAVSFVVNAFTYDGQKYWRMSQQREIYWRS